jgi:hypothetical protein
MAILGTTSNTSTLYRHATAGVTAFLLPPADYWMSEWSKLRVAAMLHRSRQLSAKRSDLHLAAAVAPGRFDRKQLFASPVQFV